MLFSCSLPHTISCSGHQTYILLGIRQEETTAEQHTMNIIWSCTARKKSAKIEHSINIYSWGGVKPIYH